MESLNESEKIIREILEADDVSPETREHAEKIYAQLEHSIIYYKWLTQISDAIQSGEIFKYFPIPEE